jgi:hypothetical protein
MKLFTVGKVGLFLDTLTHGTEKRKDEEVKTVTLTLRAQPFGAKLAAAVHHNGVRATLFNLAHPDPKDFLPRVNFALGTPRQNLQVFAAPDTAQASIAFTQAKISKVYARTEKSVTGFAFVFSATFGPIGRTELEYLQDWHLCQRFVTFDEAEPGFFDDDDANTDDVVEVVDGRPVRAPMFDDPRDVTASAEEPAHRPLHSHQKKAKGRKRGTTH